MKTILSLGIVAAFTISLVSAQTSNVLVTPARDVTKCLNIQGGHNDNGAPVELNECNGATHQRWTFSGQQIKIAAWNKCLDVTDGTDADGTKLQVWECDDTNANQQFLFATGSPHTFTWAGKGKCVDYTDGSTSDGTLIQVWTCSANNPNQIFNEFTNVPATGPVTVSSAFTGVLTTRGIPTLQVSTTHSGPAITSGVTHSGPVITSGVLTTREVPTLELTRTGPVITSGVIHSGPVITSGVTHTGPVITSGVTHTGPFITSGVLTTREVPATLRVHSSTIRTVTIPVQGSVITRPLGPSTFVTGTSTVSGSLPAETGSIIVPSKSISVCLSASSNTDGGAVVIQKCVDDSQVWSYTGGSYRIYGDKCLDVTGGITANGNKLQIWTCVDGDENQQFTYTSDNRIAWTNKGECVDLTDGSVTAGNAIQMWKCTDGDTNQIWNLA